MLEIKVFEMGGNKEIFTSETWRCAFDIREPIYSELCHAFFSTFEFDEEVTDEELIIKKLIKFRLGGRRHSLSLLEFARRLGLYTSVKIQEEGFHEFYSYHYESYSKGFAKDDHVDEEERCQYSKRESLDATTLRELIGPNERLISKDPSPGVPRFAMPRPLLLTLQDLSYRMGRMEIQQGVLKCMSCRQSYHSDTYASVFEYMAGYYGVPLAGDYAPLGNEEEEQQQE
uniref:Uncharacterized protein n=1 Tax=Tanacetum cinerariifolium TaxID=118510 RepID=A0A699I595_TANCI|nr:hypothetical protein [Tanacetum cinerariifolium]